MSIIGKLTEASQNVNNKTSKATKAKTFNPNELMGVVNEPTAPVKNTEEETAATIIEEEIVEEVVEEIEEVSETVEESMEVEEKPAQPVQQAQPVAQPVAQAEAQQEETPATRRPKKRIGKKTAVIDYLPSEYDDASTGLRQVARPDLPIDYYYDTPNKNNFDLYNADLESKISIDNFSKTNVKQGGVSIGKSQIIETCLDFIFYDLGLTPQGFKHTEDLRNYLRSHIKEDLLKR